MGAPPLPHSSVQLIDENGRSLPPLTRFLGGLRSASASGNPLRATVTKYATIGGDGAVTAIGWSAPVVTVVAASSASALASFGYGTNATAAGANSSAGMMLDSVSGTFWIGNAAGLGGFRLELYAGVDTTQTTLRLAWGLLGGAATSLATDAVNLTNCVFLGCDSADTYMQIMHNDAAGTCTKIPLGSSFPKTDGAFYKLVLSSSPNSGTVEYTVDRLDSAAAQASGSISSGLPANTFFMFAGMRVGNGAAAAVAKQSFVRALGEVSIPI